MVGVRALTSLLVPLLQLAAVLARQAQAPLSITTGPAVPAGASVGSNEAAAALHSLRVYRRAGDAGLELASNLVEGQRLIVQSGAAGEVVVRQQGSDTGGEQELVAVGTGVFGVYKLPSGHFLAIIKDSVAADHFAGAGVGSGGGLLARFGRSVRELREIELIRIPPAKTPKKKKRPDEDSKNNEAAAQAQALAMLQETFERHRFFFSLRSGVLGDNVYYDVTRSLQKNVDETQKEEEQGGHWSRCDDRFFWNANTLSAFLRSGCNTTWLVPATNAWAACERLLLDGGSNFTLSLISRRSRLRQGPRYIKRGSDEQGNVANFAETEQILTCDHPPLRAASYVQARGSIPLFWSQPEVWRLRPSIVPRGDTDLHKHAAALYTHLADLFRSYAPARRRAARGPRVYLLSLIDKKGGQGRLGQWLFAAFDFLQRNSSAAALRSGPAGSAVGVAGDALLLQGTASLGPAAAATLPERILRIPGLLDRSAVTARDYSVSGLGRARLVWFDYHQQCHGSDVSALKSLYPHLGTAAAGCFTLGVCGGKRQGAVVRTNCIDCLDRTNVVQTVVARWALLRQLRLFGELRAPAAPDALQLPFPQAEAAFRKLWADNGDHLSLLYAGTRALKRDVTRQGRRTHRGAFDDGVNSAVRYYINNYKDAQRQRGVDLVLGLSADVVAAPTAEAAVATTAAPAQLSSPTEAVAPEPSPSKASFYEAVDGMLLELLTEAREHAGRGRGGSRGERERLRSSRALSSGGRRSSLLQSLLQTPHPLLLVLMLVALSRLLNGLLT